MSVLIVANVVSGAVVSGYRRIGILKSIGFTPGQVVAAYTGQVTVAAVVGVLGGLVLGDLLALMLLHQAANAYGVGTLSVPVWVDVAVPVGMLRPGRAGRAAALDPGRPAQRGAGHRGRPGAAAGARLRRAPAVRPAAAAPAGDDRAGRAVRPARRGPRSPWSRCCSGRPR